MFEEILKDEEEHANDLTDMLFVSNPTTGKTEGEDPGTEIYGRNQLRRGAAQTAITTCAGTTNWAESGRNRTGSSTRNDRPHHEPQGPQRSRRRR